TDDFTRTLGVASRSSDQLSCFMCAFRGIFDDGGNFLERGSRLLDGRSLLLTSLGEVIGGSFDLIGSCVDTAGVFGNPPQRSLKLFCRAVEVTANGVQTGGKRGV